MSALVSGGSLDYDSSIVNCSAFIVNGDSRVITEVLGAYLYLMNLNTKNF